ncbi:MAG: hypothetical protein PWP23_1394 [Candidatus Sumerlaeota bacterium]|nr:hypothetical protein [Candidatus Sumerlaeota bacterium]
MITSAGVSAFDGNKGALATGFFRRLRDALEAHYGGPQAVSTGWISHTCFEPHVAARILAGFLKEEDVTVWHGAEATSILREEGRVAGAIIRHGGREREVRAKITLEATEYGDVLAMSGAEWLLGRESQSEFGEADAPPVADMAVQDLTICATLKKHAGRAPALPRPADYDPSEFDGAIADYCSNPDEDWLGHRLHQWDSFISYASLPNDKYLLNWPFRSNDSPDTLGVFGTAEERATALQKGRDRTLRFVYFMQNELGHPEWGLADDEYDTPDKLAYIPYTREARRVRGLHTMVEKDVLPVEGGVRPPFRADSIAVGDYFLDHHHSEAHRPPEERLVEDYPDNAPFQVPYGCLVPRDLKGLLVAEKSISVSHIVNGCTRLQPVVMHIGQAAGAAAGLCLRKGIEPADLDVRELQEFLIGEGLMLYPYRDMDHTHPAAKAVQRLAMRGVMPEGERFEFRPDDPATEADLAAWAKDSGTDPATLKSKIADGITRGDLATILAG